jgi:hypothetical protein
MLLLVIDTVWLYTNALQISSKSIYYIFHITQSAVTAYSIMEILANKTQRSFTLMNDSLHSYYINRK